MPTLHLHFLLFRDVPPGDRRGRLRRRCRLRVGPLEDRALLAGTGVDDLAGIAIPIALGTSTTGTLNVGDVVFYQVNPSVEGKLAAQVHAENGNTRLSLRNGQDQVLMQSDGQSPTDPDDLIGVDVPAGPVYLELDNLGGASGYSLTTSLTPSTAPFQPIQFPNPYQAYSPEVMVTGDFDSDGRTDLAVVNTGSNDVEVLLNNGDGTFQPPVAITVGNYPVAILSGDFTGDHRIDLAVVNYGDNDISVLLGNGDGTFQSQATYAVKRGPGVIVSGDYTGDGRTDLAILNYDSNNVSVLLGNGDGTFETQAVYGVGSEPSDLVTGDFNGDGRTDLAVDNSDDADVSVLLGGGDGTFQPGATFAVGSFPEEMISADFNGDGRSDLAVANGESGDISVLLGSGDATLQPQVTYAVGSRPVHFLSGDFDSDGRTDLAVVNADSNNISLLLGNGDGTFQSQVTYAVGSEPGAIIAGDFDGDGRTDLVIANLASNELSLLLGNGDGTFQLQKRYAVGSGPAVLVSGDFTGDGRTDLIVADQSGNDVEALLGNGDGTFQIPVAYVLEYSLTYTVDGDFDGDGRIDLAVISPNTNNLSLLLGNGDGTFQRKATYTVGNTPYGIVSGDFNGDGRIDLAITNLNSKDVSVFLGNGDGTFQPEVTYMVGPQPVAIVTGDFNGDRRTDLAVANGGMNYISVLLGNGDGTFKPQATYTVGRGPYAIITGDFNRDGWTDLATANIRSDNVSVLFGNGDGTFQTQVTSAAGSQPYRLASADFNGDGWPDLAVITYQADDVLVMLGKGDGSFQALESYPVGVGTRAIVAGDFTHDGRIDLAVTNVPNGLTVLLGNGDGTFQAQGTYAVGPGSFTLVSGDFNGDGRLDLITSAFGIDNLSVLLGNGDGTFAAAGSSVASPRATPLVADLTGDGVNDILVVNGAGDILWRKGRPQDPGTFDPPVIINPGAPSRGIAAVDTNHGWLLASVDVTDDSISLYAWRSNGFFWIGSLPTGSLPAQIVTADLNGDGWNDLVVRNAGDGTLSVVLNNGLESAVTGAGPFLPPVTLPVGTGISDVTLADVSGDGATDIVFTDDPTGEVGVLTNLGNGTFAPAVFYRASGGLYSVTDSSNPASLTTLEATSGVAAGALTAGGPPDLLAIDPGSNTLGLLRGLGGGRFANPVVLPTASPAIAIRIADLEGTGIPDTVVLGKSGVTVDRGDGKGGFLPDPFTVDVGSDPTGLTVADINHDGKLDLLVGNAFGDLLVLLGNGDGTFQPYYKADQHVALAVLPNGSATPDFIYAEQGLNRVVVDYASGQTAVVGDSSSGLLGPGAVELADLNGDGIPDLIVANSGSNNVLVYPGLGNGQFGPGLNGGNGFFTGTDPVGITVANLNGRPDLVIANQGSNDVSILLNEATPGGGFTFIPGPRLQGGPGPTSTVVRDVSGDGIPDILVSDSGANQVTLLPGVGGGFFNDQSPRVISVGSEPSQIMVGTFTPGQGPQILTVNAGSNDVTVISHVNSDAPVVQSFPTGGTRPVAAFGVDLAGNGLESLVVANNGDGLFTLLGGADGLEVEATLSNPEVSAPSALALAGVKDDEIEFYATTDGVEAAFLLAFILAERVAVESPVPGDLVTEGSAPSPLFPLNQTFVTSPVPVGSSTEGPAQLLPLNETELPLVGTLLTVVSSPRSNAALSNEFANQAELNVALLPGATLSADQGFSTAAEESTVAIPSPSAAASAAGQGMLIASRQYEQSSSGEIEPVANREFQDPSTWTRILPGAEEVFDQIREENQAIEFATDEPAAVDESAPPPLGEPLSLSSPAAQAVDAAIGTIWVKPPSRARSRAAGSWSIAMPLVLSGTLVLRASPLVAWLRDRQWREKG